MNEQSSRASRTKITVSAPGKLMLFGEHAVVYGRPCIVTAVGQRMQATVELTDEPIFQLEAPDVSVSDYKKAIEDVGVGEIPKGAKFVEVAVKNFLDKYPFGGGVRMETSSEFSSEFGFGSSSASTVCVIKALAELNGAKLDNTHSYSANKAIFDLSYKTVLDIQGKGSGFDVAAAVFGGTFYYITPGKIIEPLNIDSLPLIVGYSGLKFDTVTLVNQVSKLSEKYPQVIENVYSQIEKLVEQAKIALLNKDWQILGELMNFNEGLLSVLGVEGKKLADMIYGARDAGAYGAKLSGSGIGDCMIALSPEEKKKDVKKAIIEAGGKVIDVETNVEGVRIEV